MSDIFPKWTNKLPGQILLGGLLVGGAILLGITYYATPKYTRVGYKPVQPLAFSHEIHTEQLGLDCRYCHNQVERSWYSNIPSTSVCMNCHNQVLKDDPKLELVRESFEKDMPIAWVQIHKLPDYVYFNHSVHVNRGFSCVECHGQINEMEEVYHAKPFGMSFCLECHRDPAGRIRPLDKITDLKWAWSDEENEAKKLQRENGKRLVHNWNVESLVNCSACHR